MTKEERIALDLIIHKQDQEAAELIEDLGICDRPFDLPSLEQAMRWDGDPSKFPYFEDGFDWIDKPTSAMYKAIDEIRALRGYIVESNSDKKELQYNHNMNDKLTAVTEQLDAILLQLGKTQERMFDAQMQRDRLAEALDRIARPVWWMREDQKRKTGSINGINGSMAVSLSENAEYLRDIATKALQSLKNKN